MAEGLSPAGLEALRATAERHVGDTLLPGLVVLVAHGPEVHVEALGSLTVGGAPARRDSIFRIASTTKPITAAATLALVGEGHIALDDPIDELIPELADRRVLLRLDGPLADTVPARRSITIRDLLTFTFGFGMVMEMFAAPTPWPVVSAAQALHLSTIGPPNPAEQPDPDTWIASLGSLPLLAQPGERWLYGTGASVLGVLLERAARAPFADVLRTRILDPLGMRDTSFWTDQTARLATAYRTAGDGLEVWDPPDGIWSRAHPFADGAAGLVSTVDDLLAFARMLLAGGAGLVPEWAVREMTSDRLTAEQKAHGGLGETFFQSRSWGYCQAVRADGAYGWDGGFGSTWLVDPVRDLVVIVLTQRLFDTHEAPQAHRDIQAAAYAALP